MAEQLNNSQRKLSEEKNRVTEVNNQLRTSKAQVTTAQQELHDYKEKAARILQVSSTLLPNLHILW